MKYQYKQGDTVAYNHSYLKAVQGDKEIADRRGTVVSTKVIRTGLSLVTIQWNDEVMPRKSMSTNICRVTKNGFIDPTE